MVAAHVSGLKKRAHFATFTCFNVNPVFIDLYPGSQFGTAKPAGVLLGTTLNRHQIDCFSCFTNKLA